jgi:hypothetical protein
VFQGIVEYTGPVNDFVLFVDPNDGSAAIGNLSPFIDDPDLTGYAVRSPSEQLVTGGWTPFESTGEAGSGWDASPALASVLAELNLEDSFEFGYGTIVELGQIFTPSGTEDLEFLYTVAGETAHRSGTVVYGAIPTATPSLPGDYNGDDVVDLADYTVWRDNLGSSTDLPNDVVPGGVTQADYSIWKANFGNTFSAGASLSAIQSVPEPGGLVVVCMLVAGCFVTRRPWQK